MEAVEHADEVGLVEAAHHEVDDGGALGVVVAEKLVGDVDTEVMQAPPIGFCIRDDTVHLDTHDFLFLPFEEVAFAPLQEGEHEDDEDTGDGGQ